MGLSRRRRFHRRNASRPENVPPHDRRPLAGIFRVGIRPGRMEGGLGARSDRRKAVAVAGAGRRLPAGRPACKLDLRRSGRTRRSGGEAEAPCRGQRAAARTRNRSRFSWRYNSGEGSGTRLPRPAAAPAHVPRKAARRRTTSPARKRAAGNPPPLAAQLRRIPPGAHRRMVAGALRARQTLHPPDAAARPGPGRARDALASAAAVFRRHARGPRRSQRNRAGAARPARLRQEHAAAPARTRPRARRTARRRSRSGALQLLRPAQPLPAATSRRSTADAARVAGARMGASPTATAGVRRTARQRPTRPAARRGQRNPAHRRSRLPQTDRALARLPRRTRAPRRRHARALLVPQPRLQRLAVDTRTAGAARAHRSAVRPAGRAVPGAVQRRTWPGALAATAWNAAARPLPLAVLPQIAARPGRRRPSGAARPRRAVQRLRPAMGPCRCSVMARRIGRRSG